MSIMGTGLGQLGTADTGMSETVETGGIAGDGLFETLVTL